MVGRDAFCGEIPYCSIARLYTVRMCIALLYLIDRSRLTCVCTFANKRTQNYKRPMPACRGMGEAKVSMPLPFSVCARTSHPSVIRAFEHPS